MQPSMWVHKRFDLEILSYIVLLAGTLGDHISTGIATARPYIYESNPVAVKLMAGGLWLPLDLVLIALGIAVPFLALRLAGRTSLKGLLAYPMAHGLIRLGFCLWNLSLLI